MATKKEQFLAEQRQFTITKKIAKHGKQAIIVIPRILETELAPQTLVKITIDILSRPPNDNEKSKGASTHA